MAHVYDKVAGGPLAIHEARLIEERLIEVPDLDNPLNADGSTPTKEVTARHQIKTGAVWKTIPEAQYQRQYAPVDHGSAKELSVGAEV